MRTKLFALGVLAGSATACTFHGPAPGEPGGPTGPDYPDGSSGVDAPLGGEPGPDAAPPQPAAPECSSDASLRLCIDFEAPEPFRSKSSTSQSISTQNVGLSARGRSQAGAVGPISRMLVGESATLDVDALTASLWFQPHRVGTNQYLLDNHAQYGIVYDSDGDLQCLVNAASLVNDGPSIAPSTSEWTHVACTYDREQLRIYVNGNLDGCLPYSSSLNRNGNLGLAVAANVGPAGVSDRLTGAIDVVRVHARALTAAEICTEAGRTGCTDVCPVVD